MTSREMEERTGVAKANLRYYEAEGLLTPARGKNGYRDYSEADAALLEKIKLLRRLGVTVEELRELVSGSAALPDVLDRRLEALGRETAVLGRVERVCGALRQEAPAFDALDAPRYLAALDAPAEEDGCAPPPEAEADALPVVTSAGRRFFARLFDRLLLTWFALAAVALSGISLARVNTLAFSAIVEAATLFLEPLLLWRLGTTPGKALLGLRLSGPDGQRLDYQDWLNRHLRMLWYGKGAYIPIWGQIQGYRSLKRCLDLEPQPWDAGFAYEGKPWRPRMAVSMVLAALLAMAAAEAANSCSQLPPNRGPLTVAEFAENYNRQARYYDLGDRYYLDDRGVRHETPTPPNAVIIDVGGEWRVSPYRYTTGEDGTITAVSVTYTAEDDAQGMLAMPAEELTRLILSFAWASEETPFWDFARKLDLDLQEDWAEGFTAALDGVDIAVDVDRVGWEIAGTAAFLLDGATDHALTCTITLSMAP